MNEVESLDDDELAALTYAIAHDLRAPIRAIDGFSEALVEDHGSSLDKDAADCVRRIRAAAQHLEVMLGCVVELSHVSREPLRRERVDLSAVARSIAEKLQASNHSRNAEFAIEPDLVVDGDLRLLTLAFEHLLGNSWKFTRKHPSAMIGIGSEEQHGRRVIFVRDDGAGFDPAYAARLFAPFQRLHSPAEFEGNGIGLAIVRRIVRRHGGNARATGEIEKGATVYLDLP